MASPAAGALLALDRALARGARRDWVRLGLVLGLCGYTYTASLAIPFAAAGVWLASGQWRRRAGGWAAALLVATLVALPVMRLAANDIELVTQRPRSRIEGPPYAIGERLLDNGVRSLSMFNVHGDLISAQNVPGRRQLGLVSSALFLCGLGVAAMRWWQPRIALVLWFLLVMQLPSALALAFPQDVPGAVRASGTLIPACLLVALPLALLWRAWRQAAPSPAGWRGVGIAAVAGTLLVAETGDTWHRYFVEYPTFQSFGNYPLSRTIAAAMDGYAGRGPVYMPGYPHWLDGKALRVQLQRLPIGDLHEVHPEAFAAEVGAASPPLMVVLRSDDTERLAALTARFPNGRVTPYAAPSGEGMFVVFVTGP